MPHKAQRHPTDRLPLLADVATGRDQDTAAEVIARLRQRRPEFVDAILVVDEKGRLSGAVPLAALLEAPADRRMASLRETVHAVREDADPEHVASMALTHAAAWVPVVDHARRLCGVVPPRKLMQVLRREHVEDLHRMAGIRREVEQNSAQARSAIEAPPLARARDRLPWLLVGLAGSMLATLLMSRFEATLQARLSVAFFVPAIVYLADAIGTQTEAIAVRGLSLSHAPMSSLVWGELRTGLLIGVALALLAWPAVWLAFGDGWLATTVALSLVAAGTTATTIGLLFPWLLAHLGKDPALGSGPVATIAQDVLSLLVYLGLATLLLRT
jgi:magnesium transporter